MATHQLTRQKQRTETWSTVFPAEQKTMQESEVFVKKLLVLGLSSVTYLRTIFPESSYREQYLDGLKLKVLIDNTSCRSSNTVVSWMRSCFQAIEKKYLRQLTFAILNKDNQQEAHETYTYKFRYTDEGPVMSGPGTPNSAVMPRNTQQATEKMLRTIILLTQNMGPLPKSICLSMKLGYYDDVTPSDYEPPSFAPIGEESYTFRSKPVTIKVGSVSTRFHAMKLYVCVEKTAYPTGENSPTEVQAEEEQEELLEGAGTSRDCSTVVRSIGKYVGPLRSTCYGLASSAAASAPGIPLTHSQEDDHQVPTQSHVSYGLHCPQNAEAVTTQEEVIEGEEERLQSSNTDSEGFPVRCPCGVPCDHGLMILCDICQKWQHGACFNVLEDSEVKGSHVCEECANPVHPCTDPTLPQQPELVSFCLFRRALVLLEQTKSRVTAVSLAQQLGVDITMGNHLLQQLMMERIVYTKRKINRVSRAKLLCDAFPKYLKGHGNPRENQGMPDLTSQSLQSSKSLGDFDLDVTPDLDVASLQESVSELHNRERGGSLNNTLDETLDIMTFTQDVPVGTQAVHLTSEPCLETSQCETYSEALATAGNTLLLLDSPPEPSQKAKKRYSASMPLHSGMDVEEGSAELLERQESSETPRAQRRKMSLGTKSKQSRGHGRRPTRRTMRLNDFEVSLSQDSDLQSKNSISQDSEIFEKKKKTHQ